MNFSLRESNITKRGQTTIIANVIRFEQWKNGGATIGLQVFIQAANLATSTWKLAESEFNLVNRGFNRGNEWNIIIYTIINMNDSLDL